jgi:acetyl esterase/lipase
MSRIGFSGGSAGAPLSALQAQRTPETLLYVGFNGLYDFVNNKGFGGGNAYGQQIPSAEANSAALNLKATPPYTLLMHGSDDTTIDPSQSVRFAEAVSSAGGSSKCVIYKGEVHSFFTGQMKNACFWEFKNACIKAFNLKGYD